MNKRSLAIGMILPLAAAGAVATAPAASASHKDDSSVTCELDAWRDGRDIDVKLKVTSDGDQGKFFRVKITQNRDHFVHEIVKDKDGKFTVREQAENEKGPDVFRAYVRNIKTGDTCYDVVRVRGGGRH